MTAEVAGAGGGKTGGITSENRVVEPASGVLLVPQLAGLLHVPLPLIFQLNDPVD